MSEYQSKWKVEGYEEFCSLINDIEHDSHPIFVLFRGTSNESGVSWCPDCVKAEPIIQKVLNSPEIRDTGVFVEASVGLRNDYSSQSTDNKVRVRFAPSPTGFLHLGGLRTALYNFLFAKQNNGSFLLRIEDTDRNRFVPKAMEQMENDLNWVGIVPDESPSVGGNYGPYQQSLRLDLYQKEAKFLLENGSAYRCFCTDDRLNLIRREAIRSRQVPKYDNRCRSLTPEEVDNKLKNNEKFCIRFKLTSFKESVSDLILGSYEHDIASVEGDPVILKTDGYPTYHLANVVDDHYMEITHVLRGIEWHLSTTKHILMYKAFGWSSPMFAHLPLLLNKDGSKISKRQNDLTVQSLRKTGVYPLALVNLVSHCGGGFKDPFKNLNIQTLEQLSANFDLNLVKSSSCQLTLDRLPELNHAELCRRTENEKEFNALKESIKSKIYEKFSEKKNLEVSDEYISSVLRWSLPRITSTNDLFGPNFAFVWIKPDPEVLKTINAHEYNLPSLIKTLGALDNFERETLSKTLKGFSKDQNFKFSAFMMFLRHILSGLKEGPSVAEMMELLGKENSLARLHEALNYG